jgi:hypothetical protein
MFRLLEYVVVIHDGMLRENGIARLKLTNYQANWLNYGEFDNNISHPYIIPRQAPPRPRIPLEPPPLL